MEPPVANYTRIFHYYNPFFKTTNDITPIAARFGDKTFTRTRLDFAILMNEAQFTRYFLIK